MLPASVPITRLMAFLREDYSLKEHMPYSTKSDNELNVAAKFLVVHKDGLKEAAPYIHPLLFQKYHYYISYLFMHLYSIL